MPLDEIPANVTRSQSTKQHGSSRMDIGNDAISHAKPAPLAVQSMLRNTTELGDVGIFASRPPRLPRSRTSTSLDGRVTTSGSTSSHPHRSRGQRFESDIPRIRSKYMSSPGQLRRNDTVRSSMTAYQYQPHSRRPRPRPGPVSYYHPPYSHRSHNILNSHRSLASLRGSSGSVNAFPPYANLPPGTSRQGLPRSVSSSRSNLYEYHNQDGGDVPRQSSFGTLSRSPRSTSSTSAGRHHHRAEFNASARSFGPSPSPAIGPRRYYTSSQYSFSRTATPATGMPRHRRFDSVTSLRSAPTSPTDSIGPFYYDYSESFHGGETLLLPPHSEHPSILEAGAEEEEESNGIQATDARTPFGIVPGSAFTPAELPARHVRRPSDQSIPSRHTRNPSSKSARSQLSPPIEMPAEDVEDGGSGSRHELEARETQSEPDTAEPVPQRQEWLQARSSTHSPRDWPSPSSSIIFTSASRSPRNLSELAARAHSPGASGPIREMHSIDSVARSSLTPEGSDAESQYETATKDTFDLPTLRFRPLSIGMSAAGRSSTSPVSVRRRAGEIVSPRPERPTSSESRKRFSKILDVDSTPTLDTRSKGRTLAYGPSSRLEPVDEMSSPMKTPTNQQRHMIINSESNGKNILRTTDSNPRWSGVTSLEKSTVASILERHIECLGLGLEEETSSEYSASSTSNGRDRKDDQKDLELPDSKSPRLPSQAQDRSEPSSLQRPTSLSSATQKRLIPQRLFADVKTHNFPLANSDSEAQFSLTWTDKPMRPSYGWLSLHSASKLGAEIEESRQTLLSGEYADIESQADRKFKIRRHSSPHLPLVSNWGGPQECASEVRKDMPPCHRWNSARVSRQTSQRRRKLKLHLKTPIRKLSTPTSEEWVSTQENIHDGESELHHLGMTRVPLSAVDGFAELSGDSAVLSPRSLISVLNAPEDKSPATWSNIVSAMPMPPAKRPELKKTGSVTTVKSQRTRPSIADPVNHSRVSSRRQSHEIRARSSVPRLARPDFGPSMRASQFDLTSGFRTKSPMPKISSFSEPQGLLEGSPPKQEHQHRKGHHRQRFHSLRKMVPPSMRGFGSAGPRSDAQYRSFVVSRSCRTQSPRIQADQAPFPDTVAMSDFSYRKHRLLERVRDWCSRRCFNRRRQLAPREGFLV